MTWAWMTLAGVWEETFPFRALRGFVWVDTSVKTPAWRRRHSRRACFPGQGRGGPPKGAAGTPWRLGRSCHPTQLTSQQCTQMPQNGSEGPFSPICVHSCVPGRSRDPRVATVYTNALKRLRETIFANLCTLLRRRRLGGDAHAALTVTQPPTHTNSRSLSKLQGTRLEVWSVIQLSNEFAACAAVTHAASATRGQPPHRLSLSDRRAQLPLRWEG